jgi:hypothetical protein
VIGADEWPTFLYDEKVYNPKKEWVGLFLGEAFVRVSPSCDLLQVCTHLR